MIFVLIRTSQHTLFVHCWCYEEAARVVSFVDIQYRTTVLATETFKNVVDLILVEQRHNRIFLHI